MQAVDMEVEEGVVDMEVEEEGEVEGERIAL